MDWYPSPLKELSKPAWRKAARTLRVDLIQLQHQLRDADFPVLLVFGGVDGAGKHELAHLLTEWLDPRFIRTQAYLHTPQTEPHRPALLRYWRDLPSHGQMGIVLSGWYSPPLLARARGEIDKQSFCQQLSEIAAFEQDLVADGVLLLKFWMHLDAEAQRERLADLMADPHNVWQVNPRDWAHLHLYDDFMQATDELMQVSQSAGLPWLTVDGKPRHARAVKVTQALADGLRSRLAQPPKAAQSGHEASPSAHLAKVQHPVLEKVPYRERLTAAQSELRRHSQRLLQQGLSLVLVFEGWDAAGKGGVIRRLVQALDVRYLKVHRIAAPDKREKSHHYLWRFARRMPPAGHTAIFDRSWYGRVLVERVEGFASPARWARAPEEILRFEDQWVNAGNVLLKFWLHVSADEQLARFEARRDDPFKDWKLTDEDWRNRDKWEQYERAVNDMLEQTNRPQTPWHVVGANDKRHARIAVLEAVNSALATC